MPNIANGWMSSESHADTIALVIGYKSVSTGTITRGTTTVSTKTIRLETLSGQREMQGDNGKMYRLDAFALGEMGTDLRVGDRFVISGQRFEVIAKLPGHIDCEQYYLMIHA